jgi:hypothetical protein
MFRKRRSRKEMEDRLITAHRELQLRWGRVTKADDWDFVRKWTDEELDEGLDETEGQIQFEKFIAVIKATLKTIAIVFVVLGIAGLLLFGIKQLLTIAK